MRAVAVRGLPDREDLPPAVVSALMRALKDPDLGVRQVAADRTWYRMETLCALPELLEALQDPDETTRHRANWILGNAGAAALPGLIHALWADNPNSREGAAKALAEMVDDARDAWPALLNALADERGAVSSLAAEALGKIGKEWEVALDELIHALDSESPQVRWAAAKALSSYGEKASDASPRLLELIDDPNPDIRAEAMSCIASAREFDRNALRSRVLSHLCEPESARVREAAARVVGRVFGPEAREAVPDLIWLAKGEGESSATDAAIRALASMGVDAKDAVVDIVALLQDPGRGADTTKLLVDALRAIGPAGKRFAPALLGLVRDRGCYSVIGALAAMQEEPEDVLSLCVESILGRGRSPRQDYACDWLADYGAEGLPWLEEVLINKRAGHVIRLRAARAIGRIGAEAARALPLLESLRNGPDPGLTRIAETAISQIHSALRP